MLHDQRRDGRGGDETRREERRGEERTREEKRGGEICRERGESSRGDTSDRNEREERTVRVRRGVVHTHRSTLTISCSMLSLLIHLTRRFTPPVSLSSVIHDTHILYLLSLLLLRDSHFRFSLPPPRSASPAGVASSAVCFFWHVFSILCCLELLVFHFLFAFLRMLDGFVDDLDCIFIVASWLADVTCWSLMASLTLRDLLAALSLVQT